MRAIAGQLTRQRRVAVIGFRNSRFLASYFHRQLSLLRPNVSLLPAAGQTVAEDLVDFGREDLLVVVAMRRRIPKVRELMSLAKKRQVPCVLIADPSANELQELAQWSLRCHVHSSSLFDSYSSVSSVITLLVNLTMCEDLENSHRRLREIEQLHEEVGELKVAGVHPSLPSNLLEGLEKQISK
nr:SIS domain-containing protein [Motiliproteus sp. SC1-56]